MLYVLSLSIALAECAKLLRTPKVYNAIITTDENLTPSRAFPIIQPVIQPAIPIFSPFYSTNLFDPYNQNDVNDGRREFKVRINKMLQLRRTKKKISFQNQKPVERKSDELEAAEETINQAQDEPQSPSQNSNVPEDQPENEKSPIPLNEYGFPPSLIPLQKYPTYPYSYPFIYDSYGNFQAVQQYPVLAPSYYPQQEHRLPPIEQPMFTVGARNLNQEPSRDEKSITLNENSLPTVTNDAIKNKGNTNADIPDVAIPPIPFTIKKQ